MDLLKPPQGACRSISFQPGHGVIERMPLARPRTPRRIRPHHPLGHSRHILIVLRIRPRIAPKVHGIRQSLSQILHLVLGARAAALLRKSPRSWVLVHGPHERILLLVDGPHELEACVIVADLFGAAAGAGAACGSGQFARVGGAGGASAGLKDFLCQKLDDYLVHGTGPCRSR